jgi:putative inorganic carbon (HCO3(-)) transporter
MKWIGPALSACLLTAAFSISLFFEGAQSYAYAPALVCLVAGLLIASATGAWEEFSLPNTAPALWLMALWFYVTVSLMWSTTPFPSLVTYLVFCCLPLGFFALLLTPKRALFVAAAAAGIGLALTALGAWAILQVTILHARFPGRAGYPLLDANNLAALMNLGLLPTVAAVLTLHRGPLRAAAMAAALILFGGLVATESRAGLLSFLLMAVVLLAALRPARLGVLALGIFAVFVLLSWHEGSGGTASRLVSLMHIQQDSDAMDRLALWSATLGMIRQHPFTGTGLGSFYLTYPSHRPLADQWSAGQWAHNDPLQFAAEMGLAAPLLLFGFLGSLILRSLQSLRQPGIEPTRRALIAGPACGFFAVILHAQVEFQLYLMPVLIVSGVMLACWYEWTAQHLPAAQSWRIATPKGWQRPASLLPLAAIAFLILYPAIRCGMATRLLDQAIVQMRYGRPATFSQLLDRADAWGPATFIDAKIQRASLYIDLLKTPKGIFDQSAEQDMILYVQTTLDMAERLVPLWSDVNEKRALLYINMKDNIAQNWEPIAEAQLRTALAKNPLDLKARSQLIELRMSKGDADEAYALLNDGLERPHSLDDQQDMLALQARLAHIIALKKHYEEHAP